jgi:hypothetical protein
MAAPTNATPAAAIPASGEAPRVQTIPPPTRLPTRPRKRSSRIPGPYCVIAKHRAKPGKAEGYERFTAHPRPVPFAVSTRGAL